MNPKKKQIIGCMSEIARSIAMDEHYRRHVNISTPKPTVHYLFIGSEDAAVAYQRFFSLAYSYKDVGGAWRRVGDKLYGLFNSNYEFFELCCIENLNDDNPNDVVTTIWTCDAPDEWVFEDYDDIDPVVLGDDAFVEEFFEFVSDYLED